MSTIGNPLVPLEVATPELSTVEAIVILYLRQYVSLVEHAHVNRQLEPVFLRAGVLPVFFQQLLRVILQGLVHVTQVRLDTYRHVLPVHRLHRFRGVLDDHVTVPVYKPLVMLETAYEYLVQVGHRLPVTVSLAGVGIVVKILVPVPRQGVRVVGILPCHELHGGDQYGLAGDTPTLRETFSHHREMGKRVTVLFLPLAELVTEVEQQRLAVVT